LALRSAADPAGAKRQAAAPAPEIERAGGLLRCPSLFVRALDRLVYSACMQVEINGVTYELSLETDQGLVKFLTKIQKFSKFSVTLNF
jgi:hypothetical protein